MGVGSLRLLCCVVLCCVVLCCVVLCCVVLCCVVLCCVVAIKAVRRTVLTVKAPYRLSDQTLDGSNLAVVP